MRLFFALVMGLFAFSFESHSASQEGPNVLFIISDDLSAEALGAYGNGQVD